MKTSFSRTEWFLGILLGMCLGAVVLFEVWLMVGEPRI